MSKTSLWQPADEQYCCDTEKEVQEHAVTRPPLKACDSFPAVNRLATFRVRPVAVLLKSSVV
jgi:hypothetical protein